MSELEILEKAYKKALGNGWFNHQQTYEFSPSIEFGMLTYKTPFIFNHDFAKALWGEEIENPNDWPNEHQPMWQYHLQQMVLGDDPIKYLGDNL